MDKDKAMKLMAESHRETVKELKESIEGHIKVKRVLADKLHASRRENKRYRSLLKEVNLVIIEAIDSLNKGEKVNGLGFMYNSINQQLEEMGGDPHESS